MNYNRKKKSGTQITKKHNQKHNHKRNHKIVKRQRVKRQAITTKKNSQFTSRAKFHVQKNKRNHVKKEHKKWVKKILGNKKYSSKISRDSTERTSDEVALKAKETYADYVLKVASILAKARGAEVSEEDIKKDVKDMIKFQIKLTNVSIL